MVSRSARKVKLFTTRSKKLQMRLIAYRSTELRIVDDALLQTFREKPRCEYCLRPTPNGCDPAHIFSRGAGRLDIPINLVALCRSPCHTNNHAANSGNRLRPNRDDLLLVVALREGLRVEDIVDEVHRLRRTPK